MIEGEDYRDIPVDEFLHEYDEGRVEEKPLGLLWGEAKKQHFKEAERIIFGTPRGQAGMLIAATHVGKTTFALNIALTLAADGLFPPFIDERSGGRKIMYIDAESGWSELSPYLKKMTRDWSISEQEALDDKLLILCDEEIGGELLKLSAPEHMERVLNRAMEFQPDLIIIDTVSSLFSLSNENCNAEVARSIMRPLKHLAIKSNAAIWLVHHSGKRSEDSQAGTKAYKGRGASNFGCLARSTVLMEPEDQSNPRRVRLSVPKAKGYKLPDVIMELNDDSAWFTVRSAVPAEFNDYQRLIKVVNREMSKAEIILQLGGKLGGERTVESYLAKAVSQGDLRQPKRGKYSPVGSATSATPYGASGNCGSGSETNGLELLCA